MPKKVVKKTIASDTSLLLHVSHWVRRVGMGTMVLALAFVGINGFAATCTQTGILSYLRTAGGAWGGACADTGLVTKSVGEIVGSVIQIFLGFLGIIFLILTLYAGYLWMTAQGEKDKVKKAQDLLWSAVIGLFIVIAAQGLTYWILTVVAGAVTSTPIT